MHPTYAYAEGALIKMAEYNVDPAAFVQAAVQTQDPVALKIANALVAYEKVAGPAGLLTGPAAPGMFRRAAGRLGEFGENVWGGRAARQTANDILGTPGHGGTEWAQRALRDQNLAMGGAAALPFGVAGAAYAGGDADTYGNQAANLSNDYLGTNFGTTSRLGNMFG